MKISHRLDNSKIIHWYDNRILHIFVLIFVSGVILFPKIVKTPLNDWDEARYATSALEMVNSNNWITITYNHVPDLANTKFPLGTWLIAIDYKLFGVNEFSVRLWSVIFTILTTILVYLLGSLIRGRWVGIVSALIFITSTQVVIGHAGTTGDFDAGASFFLTLALLLFLIAYKTRKNSYLFYSMVTVGLGTMYKSFVPSFIPLVIIFIFLFLSKEIKNYFKPKILFYSALIIVAIITPWLIARSISDHSFISELLGIDYWQRLTTSAPGASYSFWFYLIQLKDSFSPWVYFLPFGLFVTFKGYIKGKNKDYLFLLVWLFSVFLIFSIASTKNFWYILPIFPAMAVVVGLFWSDVLHTVLKLKQGRVLLFVVLTILLITVVSAVYTTDYFYNLRKNHNNFSTFINQDSIRQELLSSDVIVHDYVATQSNLFYLDLFLYNKFTSSSKFQCKLKDNQRWLLSSDQTFLTLFLKSCPDRKVIGSYVLSDNADLYYYLIK